MDAADRYARAQELFARAIELGADERQACLDEACAGDDELRARVESMLESEREPGVLDQAPRVGEWTMDHLTATLPGSPRRKEKVGSYSIVRLLGEGGMGAVYEAEQSSPRRRVALKILRSALALPSAQRRFEREAELLGRMRHPGIAEVFEAGIDEDAFGQPSPWFAMQLVHGQTITAHARSLDPGERLELLAKVCDAVGHAHAQGIVHRDLKPDNVLVDEHGQPKVLDFGVARVADAAREGLSLLTQTGDIVGTLAYMSPEQARGESRSIDARADVYALGVIAHELLCGELPQDLGGLPLAEAIHRISGFEFDRLESGIADRDLDSILATALCHDPQRRYGSANELAADLRRYLRREPIVARRPSLAYRAIRYAQRNAASVIAVGGIVLALSMGLISTGHQLGVSRRVEAEARRDQYRAHLSAAIGALRVGRVAEARQELGTAPESLRGWEWRHLMTTLDHSLLSFQADPTARQLEFSEDGRELTMLTDARITRLATATGEQLADWTLEAPGGRFSSLSPGGVRALVRSPALTLRDLSSGDSATLTEDLPIEWRGSFFRGGERIWFATDPEPPGVPELLLFDGRSGAALGSIQAHSPWTFPALGGPDDGLVVLQAEGTDIAAAVFDLATGDRLTSLPWDGPGLEFFAVSPDGKRVVGATRGGRVSAWSALDGRPIGWDEWTEAVEIQQVEFNSSGTRLLVSDTSGPTYLLDAHDGTVLALLSRAERSGVAPIARFSPNGELVASAAAHDSIWIADARDGTELARLRGHEAALSTLEFSQDGKLLASVDLEGVGKLWRLDEPSDPGVLTGHEGFVYELSFSPDGRRIASAAWDQSTRIWDADSGMALATLRAPSRISDGRVAFSPDGNWIASVHVDEVVLWNASTAEAKATLVLPEQDPGTARPATALSWHPTEALLAIGWFDRAVQVVRLRDGAPPELTAWPMRHFALSFSPDGRTLAGSVGDSIQLWDVATLQMVGQLDGHEGHVRRLAHAADGELLASASDDGTVRVWDLATGETRQVLRGESNRALAVAWSPDGQRIAWGGDDDVVRIWDVTHGTSVAALEGHASYVHSIAFSPDGRMLASCSGDETVRLWDTVSLHDRRLARREREALLSEVQPILEREWLEVDTRSDLVHRLRHLPELDEQQRRVALDLAMVAVRDLSGPDQD